MKKQIETFRAFCKKPLIAKIAVTLSSMAVGIALYSHDPCWYDQRPMPDALKKKLY